MKEQKSNKPRLHPEKPPSSDMTMQTEIQAPHGKLSRDVQRKLGETLQAMFDEIVKEGVPDRFAKLLEQIEGGAPAGESTEQFTKSGDSDVTGSSDPVGSGRPVRKTGDEGSNG